MVSKRFLCLLLTLVMLLTGLALSEEAEEEVPYDPERDVAGVHLFDYADTIVPGQVRFVCQQLASAKLYGWGKYSKNRSTTYGPAHNCTAAVQSMAFSYIGIDATPETVVSQVTSFITNYGFEEADMAYRTGYSADQASLDRFLDRFLKDEGEGLISPVIVHYQNGRTKSGLHQHCILVIGRNEDGSYIAVDPTQNWNECIKSFTVYRVKNGRAYIKGDIWRGSENMFLDAVEQYYLVDSTAAVLFQ